MISINVLPYLVGQMRSLRIFYSDSKCTCGQLVIASRESQYKILHFHHGGLDRLADTFGDWKFLAEPQDAVGNPATAAAAPGLNWLLDTLGEWSMSPFRVGGGGLDAVE